MGLECQGGCKVDTNILYGLDCSAGFYRKI